MASLRSNETVIDSREARSSSVLIGTSGCCVVSEAMRFAVYVLIKTKTTNKYDDETILVAVDEGT